MAINSGVNISKAVGFAVLGIPNASGVNISKAVAYAVLDRPPGVDISKAVAFAVIISPQAPIWPSVTLPNGFLGLVYSASWDLTPASSPTTYSLQSGSLPTGLSLSSPGGDIGQLSGTPTVLGTFTFTLRATNAFGFADKNFSVTVSPVSAGGAYTFWG
jgi:hypothetical protein